MRKIVLVISLLFALSCSQGDREQNPVEGDVSIAYLCSLASERSQLVRNDIWVEGCVVMNDKLGESYKSFMLYDGTAGIEVKVDVDDVDRVVPLYAGARIRCSGLYVGREGDRYVLGAKPTAEYVVNRISGEELFNYVTLSLEGDARVPARKMSIAEIGYDDVMCYVRVDGVHLKLDERGLSWCDDNAEEVPAESSLRHFTDGVETLTVATQNRCHYAMEHILYDVVTLIGVVDSYRGELVLRLSDHKVFIP
ncbi:MAG: hypothetical protein J6Q21_02805 [Alistipes sp.]|nr:hypothetical protein [Alistipes sp.]